MKENKIIMEMGLLEINKRKDKLCSIRKINNKSMDK
jgi:hypothetical protein